MPIFGKSQEAKEIERQVKFKQGMSRVRGFIDRCREAQRHQWDLGKRALRLGDRKLFTQIARGYLRTGEISNRWERYMVAAESVNIQRGHVRTTREFVSSMSALSESMMAGAKPEDIVKMQVELEKALAKAQTIDDTLAAVMDASSDSIFSAEGLSEADLKEVERAMTTEATHEEEATVQDQRIEDSIKRIEAEMRKETK